MSRQPRPTGGKAYTTKADFQLTASERLRALLGGKVSVKVTIVATPGASNVPTKVEKEVTWPW